MLTLKEIDEIWRRSKKKVVVWCDENHGHHAGCLTPKDMGTEADVAVCQLHDTLVEVLDKVKDLVKELPR